MSNTSEFDDDLYDWFVKLLVSQGCPEDKAIECVDAMKEPPKRTYGDLTVREVWDICHAHPRCKDCPLGNDLCMAFLWQRPEGILNVVVDL